MPTHPHDPLYLPRDPLLTYDHYPLEKISWISSYKARALPVKLGYTNKRKKSFGGEQEGGKTEEDKGAVHQAKN
jgi:hypothetical protein